MKYLYILFLLYYCFTASSPILDQYKREVERLKNVVPLQNYSNVFFWRPQKVGSSTLVSVLVSYAYRYNILHKKRSFGNCFCIKILKCLSETKLSSSRALTNHKEWKKINQLEYDPKEVESEKLKYQISLNHQICNLPSYMLERALQCAFSNPKLHYVASRDMKELFIVREPLFRMISIYYFWGELLRLRNFQRKKNSINAMVNTLKSKFNYNDTKTISEKKRKIKNKKEYSLKHSRNDESVENISTKDKTIRRKTQEIRLGKNFEGIKVVSGLFTYHGNESTVPDDETALAYANKFPLHAGMPGPSYTWSTFSNSPSDAINVIKTDRIMSLVLDRLDESLVVASHYLNWTLADMVTVINRKALSTHPKPHEWPKTVTNLLKEKLDENGEYLVYNAVNRKLDERIQVLYQRGYNVSDEVKILKNIRDRVSKLCLQEPVLNLYRDQLFKENYESPIDKNKLRESQDSMFENGHAFSYNGELLYSFDICGACEAHSMILSWKLGLSRDISNSLSLQYLPEKYRKNNINFIKCPSYSNFTFNS